MRFEDKISVTFDIDKDLDDINIPCFCVQTLVENAYVHGLEPKDTNGHLTISIKKDNENKFLLINIIDDGVGFEKIPKFDRCLICIFLQQKKISPNLLYPYHTQKAELIQQQEQSASL